MDNKANILEIALDLFTSKGYEATGVQEIVKKSNVTKPTLYHYFGSKRGLLDELLKQYFEILLPEFEKAAQYERDLPKTLYNITKTFFDFAQKNNQFYRMQMIMASSSPESETHEAVSVYYNKMISTLDALFVTAVREHGNMRGRSNRYAFTFFGMINTYITLYLNGQITLKNETIHLAVHQFSHGIYS